MKDRFRVLAIPDVIVRERLRQEALRPDLDLPTADRSSRAQIVSGRTLAVGDVVTLVDGIEVAVLAPGRGRNLFQGGWIDDNAPCRGTFFASQIASVRSSV